MAIDVLLAGANLVVREAIQALLESDGDCRVVGNADSDDEAIRLARELHPDVAVFDIDMPRENGWGAARETHALMPDIRTVFLTRNTEESTVLAALQDGVRGYVVKTQTGGDLLQAIRDVVRGHVYISPHISQTLVDVLFAKSASTKTALTDRELQILQLTAEGNTSREIAELLGSSSRTVDTHRSRIMGKLEIKDRSSLVRYALRQGLVEP